MRRNRAPQNVSKINPNLQLVKQNVKEVCFHRYLIYQMFRSDEDVHCIRWARVYTATKSDEIILGDRFCSLRHFCIFEMTFIIFPWYHIYYFFLLLYRNFVKIKDYSDNLHFPFIKKIDSLRKKKNI